MSPVHKPARGFSFVELVAVIAIFGVAAVGVFGALQLFGCDSWVSYFCKIGEELAKSI